MSLNREIDPSIARNQAQVDELENGTTLSGRDVPILRAHGNDHVKNYIKLVKFVSARHNVLAKDSASQDSVHPRSRRGGTTGFIDPD